MRTRFISVLNNNDLFQIKLKKNKLDVILVNCRANGTPRRLAMSNGECNNNARTERPYHICISTLHIMVLVRSVSLNA
jgi:hypothetical protein